MSTYDEFEEHWERPRSAQGRREEGFAEEGFTEERGEGPRFGSDRFDGAGERPLWWSGRVALAAALCLVGLIAVGCVVFGAAGDDSKAAAYPVLPSVVPPRAAATEPAAAAEAREIVVSVVGAVRSPGLARLVPGARVSDALEAAGGLSPEAEASELNLAQRLEDGDQVVVGSATTAVTPEPVVAAALPRARPAPSPRQAPSSVPPRSGKSRCECGANRVSGGQNPGRASANVNTATEAELDSVPGIGKGIARAIVQYRASHGRIRSLDELAAIRQVGAGRLKKLRPFLRV